MIKTKISIIILALLITGSGLYAFQIYKGEPASVQVAVDDPAITAATDDLGAEVIIPSEPPMEGYMWFANNDYGFAFQHSKEMRPSMFGVEEGGNIVLVEGKDNQQFQIYITDFDEDIPLVTADRVRRDIPDMVVEDPQEALLHNDLRALIFWSKNDIGKTREVWIVYGGSLYQITAPAVFDTELAKIMTTWRFE